MIAQKISRKFAPQPIYTRSPVAYTNAEHTVVRFSNDDVANTVRLIAKDRCWNLRDNLPTGSEKRFTMPAFNEVVQRFL